MHILYMCSISHVLVGTHIQQSLAQSFAPVMHCYDGPKVITKHSYHRFFFHFFACILSCKLYDNPNSTVPRKKILIITSMLPSTGSYSVLIG